MIYGNNSSGQTLVMDSPYFSDNVHCVGSIPLWPFLSADSDASHCACANSQGPSTSRHQRRPASASKERFGDRMLLQFFPLPPARVGSKLLAQKVWNVIRDLMAWIKAAKNRGSFQNAIIPPRM